MTRQRTVSTLESFLAKLALCIGRAFSTNRILAGEAVRARCRASGSVFVVALDLSCRPTFTLVPFVTIRN